MNEDKVVLEWEDLKNLLVIAQCYKITLDKTSSQKDFWGRKIVIPDLEMHYDLIDKVKHLWENKI